MPEIIAILYGGIWSWYSACWIELRMPKSPQPGHQSTCTSVLYCCRTNFFGAAAAVASGMGHHDLLFLLGERRTYALDDLIARERPAIVFQDVVVERDPGLLGDQGAKLRRVVVFDQHRQPCTAQDPPRRQREVGMARTVERELRRRRNLAGRRLQLRHALSHHGNSVLDAFGDVALRIVLVAGGREDRTG